MRSPSETAFSGVVRVDRADRDRDGEGLRPGASRLRDPERGRHAVRDRERHEGPDGAHSREPDRGRRARALDDARSVLGDDLPLIGDDVTVEHLLAHRSGIGDYLDEDVRARHRRLPDARSRCTSSRRPSSTSPCSTGTRRSSRPDERFAYCNGGYVVLALIAERASGVPFHELVLQRVCEPAGMRDTEFLRSDELPGRDCARLPRDRRRVEDERLPPAGAGQRRRRHLHHRGRRPALWTAFFAGRIVSPEWVAEMVRPRSDVARSRSARPRLLAPRDDATGDPRRRMPASRSARSTTRGQT